MRFYSRNIPFRYLVLMSLIVFCWNAGCTVEADQGANIQKAINLIESGKPNEAIELLSPMINENTQRTDIYTIRGAAYYEMTEFTKAIQDFTHAIELTPQCAKCYYARCRAYEKLNNLQHAYDDISRAIEIDPKQSEFYFKRGWIALMKTPTTGDSVEDFSKAMTLNPDQTVRSLRARSMAYEFSGDYDSALKDWMEIERLGEADTKLYFKMVSLNRFSRNSPQEEAYLEKGMARFAEDEKAGRTKAADYLEIGQFFQNDKEDVEKALDYYHRGLSRYPEDAMLHILTAKAYAGQGDKTNALVHVEKAKAIHISAVEFIRSVLHDSDWDSIRDTDEFKNLLN